jgi:hypothetical protein
MTPLERQIVDSNFEKNAGVMQYVRQTPAYLRSVFTPDALREAGTIFKSWPGQFKQGPIDLYNLGIREGAKSIGKRFIDVNRANPAGAPIAFVTPKVVVPAGLAALASLKGDSSESNQSS